jgi:prenyltransferase beta subunit
MRPTNGFVLLLLVQSAPAQTPEQVQQTIKYVKALQQPDGGFVGAAPDPKLDQAPRSSLRATSAAIRTLKYFGGELPDRDKTAKFVTRCFDEKTGGYGDVSGGKPDVFLTAVGIMAAAELKLPPDPYVRKAVAYLTENAKGFEDVRIAAAGLEAADTYPEKPVTDWLEQMEKLRNPDGSYGKPEGDARMTGSVVAMILRIHGRQLDGADARAKSLRVLRGGQHVDGGYGKADARGSDLETTYRVMRAFHMLRENPKDATKMREFIAKCRNADGGYGVAPGQPSSVGGCYYAGIIRYWLN